MAMRKREGESQPDFWIPTAELAKSPGHPFYQRLNKILAEARFDAFVEERCARFYAERKGRPSIPPGVYMRMLLVGFFEGLDSERAIAWRCADSLSLRQFLGYDLSKATPEHSSLSRIRQRLDVEVHQEVFAFVLQILARQGLLRGRAIGVDATTLEANAALRSIVRREDGTSYQDFLIALAKASGIETPTRADLAKLDKKRAKKGSNDDWKHPHDPDAKITKMKDGRTHLAHKAEHSVDLDSGAVMAVTVQDATVGDSSSLKATMVATVANVFAVMSNETSAKEIDGNALTTWVADKGYHSNATMKMAAEVRLKTYISEPNRGQRRWKDQSEAQAGTYANRRRVKSKRGRRLMRRRGELVERSFAHCLETGGMRRVYLRGQLNILKRYLVHVAGFNLSLVMRKLIGAGTPRGLQGRLAALVALLRVWLSLFERWISSALDSRSPSMRLDPSKPVRASAARTTAFSTGC